jgi:hypothetical protein
MGVLEQYGASCSLSNKVAAAVIVDEPYRTDYAACEPTVQ